MKKMNIYRIKESQESNISSELCKRSKSHSSDLLQSDAHLQEEIISEQAVVERRTDGLATKIYVSPVSNYEKASELAGVSEIVLESNLNLYQSSLQIEKVELASGLSAYAKLAKEQGVNLAISLVAISILLSKLSFDFLSIGCLL